MMTAEVETRMLAKADADAVELTPIGEGVYLTHSRRTPAGVVYRTSATTCTCRGFQTHGHCKHVALVKTAEAKATCPLCHGTGFFLWTTSVSRTSKITTRIPCPRHARAAANPWKGYS